jgi:hypothetical protein
VDNALYDFVGFPGAANKDEVVYLHAVYPTMVENLYKSKNLVSNETLLADMKPE